MESKKVSYIPKEDRKTILLLADDLRFHSGIATMSREIVLGTASHFNWVSLGALSKHPDEGKTFDLSQSINEAMGINDAHVKLIASSGYGDASIIRKIMDSYEIDAVMIFTDPRYWTWLFDIEREIRSKVPLMYLNIWDAPPAPMYNKNYYESCDLLMAISKQTKNLNEIVLGNSAKDKTIRYVPHGINEKTFFPITESSPDYQKVLDLKKELGVSDKQFIVSWNSRNIHRKKPSDMILAYKEFCDKIGKEAASKCALVMHTVSVDNNGTDLDTTIKAFCDSSYVTVKITNMSFSPEQMNHFYNMSDVTALISSNEGWGLSLTEAMMAGRMIIANVTGGMQDQLRFEDDNGNWINFSPEFPSNHKGTYRKCGDWGIPVFPSNISIMGSVPTPYIYDDRASIEDVRDAILHVYNLPKEVRESNGQKAREWATSDESGMSARMMCNNVVESIETTLSKFKPRPRFDFEKVERTVETLIPHTLYEY
jgi:glycosyltransferase involved in cell wall biosynthesis